MPFPTSGTLTTDKRETAISQSWDTQTEWSNYQSNSSTIVENGTVKLEFLDYVTYDFETGDLSEWDSINTFFVVEDRVNSGTYSGYINNTPEKGTYYAKETPDLTSGGAQISEFEYYYNETGNSVGGGIRLLNSNGSVECGFTSDNPQWIIDDGNGDNQVDSPNSTDIWIRVTINFNWSGGTFDVEVENLSNSTISSYTGRPLKIAVDIESFQVDGYTSAQGWQPDSGTEMWVDDIKVSP